jgi:hypothetical protein
MPLAYLIDSA